MTSTVPDVQRTRSTPMTSAKSTTVLDPVPVPSCHSSTPLPMPAPSTQPSVTRPAAVKADARVAACAAPDITLTLPAPATMSFTAGAAAPVAPYMGVEPTAGACWGFACAATPPAVSIAAAAVDRPAARATSGVRTSGWASVSPVVVLPLPRSLAITLTITRGTGRVLDNSGGASRDVTDPTRGSELEEYVRLRDLSLNTHKSTRGAKTTWTEEAAFPCVCLAWSLAASVSSTPPTATVSTQARSL